MSITTLIANKNLDGNIEDTRYWKVGSASNVSANAKDNLYVGITDGYTHRRSRIIFYPNSSNFTNETITKITLTVKVKNLFSSSARTANTAIRYSSTNSDTDEAYNSAAYFNDIELTTENKIYNIEITDSTILNNISSWCKNGTPFSLYFGRGTNDSTKTYGLQLYGYSVSGAPTLAIEHIPSASTGTISSDPTIGSEFTVNITSVSSNYTHKVIIQSNKDSSTKIESDITSEPSLSYTILEEDTNKWIADGASSQANTKLIIETYLNSKLLGKNEYNFTLYAKTNPIVTWDNEIKMSPEGLTELVSGYGQVKLTLKATPDDKASSISYFRIKINSCNVVVDKKYTAKNNLATINDLPKPYTASNATFSIDIYAINNRGKESAPTTLSTTCYAYALPSLLGLKVVRSSDEIGTEDLMGTYIYGFSKIAISNSDNDVKNILTSLSISINSVSLSAENITISDSNELNFYQANVSPENEYTITIIIKDKVATNTITIKIPSSNFVLHVKTGGKSIGIGSAAGEEGTIKLGWKLLVDKGIEFTDTGTTSKPLPITLGGTGASSADGALTNLNALPLSGGRITGPLASKTYRLYYTDNEDESNIIYYNTIPEITDLRGKNIHRVFLGAVNQRVLIVSGTDPKFYMRNFKADGTIEDGEKIYTFLHDGNYKDYVDLYYSAGSKITLNDGILFGYSTSNNTIIRILIPLPKSLAKISSVSFSYFECTIRDRKGYAIQSSLINGTAVKEYKEFINVTETKILKEQQAILVQLDASTANGGPSSWSLENNGTLSVQPSNIVFTLN